MACAAATLGTYPTGYVVYSSEWGSPPWEEYEFSGFEWLWAGSSSSARMVYLVQQRLHCRAPSGRLHHRKTVEYCSGMTVSQLPRISSTNAHQSAAQKRRISRGGSVVSCSTCSAKTAYIAGHDTRR